MLASNIEEAIIESINDRSGAIKYVELVADLVALGFMSSDDLDALESHIRSSKSYKVLDYTFKPMSRGKMIVYTE